MHPEVPLIMKLENNGYPLGIRWLENTVDTTPLSYVKTAQVEEEPGFSPIPDIYDLKDTGLPKTAYGAVSNKLLGFRELRHEPADMCNHKSPVAPM